MTEDIQAHLKAIQAWLDHVDQTPLPAPAAKGLTPDERHQLQKVNKAIEQLAKLGVEIPGDLRSLKLRLSANDVQAVSNPDISRHLGGVESLIDGLRELLQGARALRDKLKSGVTVSGTKRHYGVSLEELLESGHLSTDDRLELQWKKDGPVIEGKVRSDGSVSAKTDAGWKQYDTLSAAATGIGERSLNGWDHWSRVEPDGSRTPLTAIRAKFMNEGGDL